MILAGDIGGTSTRLGLFEVRKGRLNEIVKQKYPSRDYPRLSEILRLFMDEQRQPITHVCLGIAGPILNNQVETPNLPWRIDGRELAEDLGLGSISLINDLEANAYGIPELTEKDLVTLNPGAPKAVGNVAVISAGTGLGKAGLFWDGRLHHPFVSEGGHCDFAARNEHEAELLFYLRKRYGHVSYERVLSGPGLVNLYDFLRDTERYSELPQVRQQMEGQLPAAVITERALAGTCELCSQALELFISLYGAEAGNFALDIMSLGGVYLGGGIVPRIIDRLHGPTFLQSFIGKGRMQKLLEAIPVRAILNDMTALWGAARCSALRGGLLTVSGA
jgi:glucokinase